MRSCRVRKIAVSRSSFHRSGEAILRTRSVLRPVLTREKVSTMISRSSEATDRDIIISAALR